MRAFGLVLLAVLLSVAGHYPAAIYTAVDTCGISDQVSRPLADDSWQGWTCGREASSFADVPAPWVFVASALLAAALAVRARAERERTVGCERLGEG